jgi:hypothetical protein
VAFDLITIYRTRVMGCNFNIDFPQSASQLLSSAEGAMAKAGGKLEGNEKNGIFRLSTPFGKIKGTYLIENSTIYITVSEKPMLVGCNRIENELRNHLINQAV